MGSRELFKKIKQTLINEGVFSLVNKTKNYAIFKVASLRRKDEMKDILFINGCTLPHPERYRVDHQIEQLESNGLSVDKFLYTNFDSDKVKFYRGIILFRCPITDEVEKIIEKAHYFNKKVFFDIDDLVIDRKYTDKIKYIQEMSLEDKKQYNDGVLRMGRTMKKCDYCITTTPALARELGKYGKEVFINKNVASEKMVQLSIEAMKRVTKNDEKIKIGYLSGSITHNPDFELIKPAIIKIMEEFSNVNLHIMGYLDLPEDLNIFESRIIKEPFCDWQKLPEVIAGLDINLAPIEKTIFNEAKSENKWTEAALCKVVTVASDFGIFKEVIEDERTGVLCENEQEWYKKIKDLIENPDKREKIADAANKKVMKEYITTYTGAGLAKFIKSKLAKDIAIALPSTNISGGVNVVIKHCNILRNNGWDVTIINMDKNEKNLVNNDGEINVVSAIIHDLSAKFDRMVATLYTTLRYIKKYPNVDKRMYLVQNFETNFNNYGSPEKRVANSTYVDNNIEYLTISKWCKNWLEKDFGQKVKFAPNGIDVNHFEFKKRNFNKEKIKILVEGNSKDYYKNVDESFKIVEKLDKNKFEIIYLSYNGEPKSWYRVDKFYHKVPHSEVGKIYGECDILLKTSILESFSYPPLEMMATGGYVVAVPNEGNREYLKDGENCLFYKQGDIDEAVEKIEEIIKDEKLREKLAKNGRKTAEERDWKKVEKEILKLYE